MSTATRTFMAFAALAFSLGSVPAYAQGHPADRAEGGHSWHGTAPSHVSVTAPARVSVTAPTPVAVTAPAQVSVTAPSRGSVMPPTSVPVTAPSQVPGTADAHARHGDHPGDHFLHGHDHHHHHHHCCFEPFWGGVGIGIGLGYYYDGEPWYQGDLLLESPPGDLVIYPRNGQSPEQTEADRQDCNRWAATQPDAVAHASVFRRAIAACMEARGYTVR